MPASYSSAFSYLLPVFIASLHISSLTLIFKPLNMANQAPNKGMLSDHGREDVAGDA
jgi:hypothetical protein